MYETLSAHQCFGPHFGAMCRLMVPCWRPLDFEGVPESITFRKIQKQTKKNTYLQEGALNKHDLMIVYSNANMEALKLLKRGFRIILVANLEI